MRLQKELLKKNAVKSEPIVVNLVNEALEISYNETLKIHNASQAIYYLVKNQQIITEAGSIIEYALNKLCHELDEAEDIKGAVTVGEYLYKYHRHYWAGILSYANALANNQDFKQAIAIIESVKDFRQHRTDMWSAYCFFLWQNNQRDKAIIEYASLIKKVPEDLEICYRYALTLVNVPKNVEIPQQELTTAKNLLEIILKKTSNHWLALKEYGFILLNYDEDYEGSLEKLEIALSVVHEGVPVDATLEGIAAIYNLIAICNEKMLKDAQAKKLFAIALELDKSSPAASGLQKLALDKTFFATGKMGEKLRYKDNPRSRNKKFTQLLERLRKLDPDRWEKRHYGEKKTEKLVSLIPAGSRSHKSPLRSKAAKQKTDDKQELPKSVNHKNTYKEKLAELQKLMSDGEKQFPNQFKNWFEKNYVKLPNGSNGLLIQAQILAENTIYSAAILKLDTVLSAVENKIDIKDFPDESKKLDISVGSVQIKESEEIKKIKVPETTLEEPIIPPIEKSILVETNTIIQTSSATFIPGPKNSSLLTKFWQLVRGCCPQNSNNDPDESTETVGNSKKNN